MNKPQSAGKSQLSIFSGDCIKMPGHRGYFKSFNLVGKTKELFRKIKEFYCDTLIHVYNVEQKKLCKFIQF